MLFFFREIPATTYLSDLVLILKFSYHRKSLQNSYICRLDCCRQPFLSWFRINYCRRFLRCLNSHILSLEEQDRVEKVRLLGLIMPDHGGFFCALINQLSHCRYRTDSLVNKLVVYTVNTGLLTVIDASVGLISYAASPTTLIFIAFYLNLSKCMSIISDFPFQSLSL